MLVGVLDRYAPASILYPLSQCPLKYFPRCGGGDGMKRGRGNEGRGEEEEGRERGVI
jgi:hypothetical protein